MEENNCQDNSIIIILSLITISYYPAKFSFQKSLYRENSQVETVISCKFLFVFWMVRRKKLKDLEKYYVSQNDF